MWQGSLDLFQATQQAVVDQFERSQTYLEDVILKDQRPSYIVFRTISLVLTLQWIVRTLVRGYKLWQDKGRRSY